MCTCDYLQRGMLSLHNLSWQWASAHTAAVLCVDGHVNVEGSGRVKECARRGNVDAQSAQDSLSEMTAFCESWWGEAWATSWTFAVISISLNRTNEPHSNMDCTETYTQAKIGSDTWHERSSAGLGKKKKVWLLKTCVSMLHEYQPESY